MAHSITEAFVRQYSATVRMLTAQRMSKLRPFVDIDTDVQGESKSYDAIGVGPDVPNKILVRHGDTPLNTQEHSRRWIFFDTYDVADLIDKKDRLDILLDPNNSYTRNQAGAMGRQMDDVIITAFDANVVTGATPTGSSAFPAGNVIGASGVGLTISKLLTAKEALDAAEVDEMERYVVCTARQLTNLLNDDRVTSADYNVIRALVQGDIDTYAGFRFIRCQRLKVESGARACYAFTRSAITFGLRQDVDTVVSERPDKRHATQIYTWGSWGAVRREDAKVLKILCVE